MPVLSEVLQDTVKIRRLQSEDRSSIRDILYKITQFTEEERLCALELVDIYIKQGEHSGYDFFVSLGIENKLFGYVCFGKIPLTDACFDIYWMVVTPEHQKNGVGTKLMYAVEEKLKYLGARKIFIETSSQKSYISARNFYQGMDFRLISCIKNFYKPGDDKLVYVKEVERK